MKNNIKFGLISIFAVSADTASADYILDVPAVAVPGSSWSFRDINTTNSGTQANSWASIEDGALVFKTDSTVDSNGVSAGVQTFSRWGGTSFSDRVARFDYILDGGGLMLVKAVLVNGQSVMITPNYAGGSTAAATRLLNQGLNNPIKVNRTGDVNVGYPWQYVDADYILDGNQINVWVNYDNSKKQVTFRTADTIDANGNWAGNRIVNSFGSTSSPANQPSEVYTINGKIFAVTTASAYGSTKIVLTPNFNPSQTLQPILPEIPAI
jgi:hypothetical protein